LIKDEIKKYKPEDIEKAETYEKDLEKKQDEEKEGKIL